MGRTASGPEPCADFYFPPTPYLGTVVSWQLRGPPISWLVQDATRVASPSVSALACCRTLLLPCRMLLYSRVLHFFSMPTHTRYQLSAANKDAYVYIHFYVYMFSCMCICHSIYNYLHTAYRLMHPAARNQSGTLNDYIAVIRH